MRRTQVRLIKEDLKSKIVFLVGPRQVGKTWLAKEIAQSYTTPMYLNYDSFEDREIIKNELWLESTDLLIFDEIHKMPNWKNFIKGVFDTKSTNLHILATGSARLDTFRQSGDSLAGRFFSHRLLPFSPSELKNTEYANDINLFLIRGGFPEPFLVKSDARASRWRMQYIDGLIRNDILDFENVHDLKAIQLLLSLLRERVGSPVSLSSLANDINVAPNTIKKYLQIFESLFIVFRVSPYSKNIARSILKESKIYFFDNGLVKGNEGIQFENLMAISLLKYVYLKVDEEGQRYELKYLRTKEGKEVDFCVVNDNKPELMIEVKNSDKSVDKSLIFFNDRYNIKAIQVVNHLKHEKKIGNVEIRRAIKFLKEL